MVQHGAINVHRINPVGKEQVIHIFRAVFEADLHRHVHKENNILLPRALAMTD